MSALTEGRALTCGYMTVEALAEVDGLPMRDVRTLAAMALTHRDSVVSDRQRDLDRGTHELTGREPYWWTV